MAEVNIVLNTAGVRELLRSREMADICEEQAAILTRATGVPYVSDVYTGPNRVNAGGQGATEDD